MVDCAKYSLIELLMEAKQQKLFSIDSLKVR